MGVMFDTWSLKDGFGMIRGGILAGVCIVIYLCI